MRLLFATAVIAALSACASTSTTALNNRESRIPASAGLLTSHYTTWIVTDYSNSKASEKRLAQELFADCIILARIIVDRGLVETVEIRRKDCSDSRQNSRIRFSGTADFENPRSHMLSGEVGRKKILLDIHGNDLQFLDSATAADYSRMDSVVLFRDKEAALIPIGSR